VDAHQRLAGAEWIVAADVRGGGAEALVLRGAPLDEEEVEARFGERIREREVVTWDDDHGRVRAVRRRTLGALVLSEGSLRDPRPSDVAAALTEGVRTRGLEALPWSDAERQLLDRSRFLHGVDPERFPPADVDTLTDELERWLTPFLAGRRSWSDLRSVPLADALLARLDHDARRLLDRWAPTHLEAPTGTRVRIDYAAEGGPTMAVRLQEVFGWRETPRLAGGRVPVTLELLSPARRPVQITRDLESFWENAYFEVRKDLRGRYPKHVWPEDPLTAEPTRRTKRGTRA
jgi:ATP-dependent helicase HrpB